MRAKYLILLVTAVGLTLWFLWYENTQVFATDLLELDLPEYFPSAIESPENPLSKQGVELGRLLFYDPVLSKDSTISCSTCHQQSRAFTDGLPRSTGMDGRQLEFGALTLTNVRFVNLLGWEGTDTSLEIQALKPVVLPGEMDQRFSVLVDRLDSSDFYRTKFKAAFGPGDITVQLVAKALAQFEKTLISSNSKYDHFLTGDIEFSSQEFLGMELFSTNPDPEKGIRGAGCINCHQGALFQGSAKGFDGFKNNGLFREPWAGLIRNTGKDHHLGKFRVPTLRNIEVTAPYMHLGNFGTLQEVLDHYSHNIRPSTTLDSTLLMSNSFMESGDGLGLRLTNYEEQAIIAFLKTLTDHHFLSDSSYANPFD